MTFRQRSVQITEWASPSAAGTYLSRWLTGWLSGRARFERARLLSAGEASRSLKWASEWRRRRADVMKTNGGSPAPRRASCWADRWWTAATCNTNHSDDSTTSAQSKLFHTALFHFQHLSTSKKNMLHDVFQIQSLGFYASATVLREFLHIYKKWWWTDRPQEQHSADFVVISAVTIKAFCDLTASRSREHIIDSLFWHKGQHGLEDELIRLWRSKVYNQEVRGLWSGHYSTPQLRNTSMTCMHGGVQPWGSNYNKLVQNVQIWQWNGAKTAK